MCACTHVVHWICLKRFAVCCRLCMVVGFVGLRPLRSDEAVPLGLRTVDRYSDAVFGCKQPSHAFWVVVCACSSSMRKYTHADAR